MLNKQELITLINKFIGKIKPLFSHFANKFHVHKLVLFTKLIAKLLLELKSKYILIIKNCKVNIKNNIQQTINNFKSLNVTNLILKIKSNQFINNFLLGHFYVDKEKQNIPSGFLGIKITNKNVILIHVLFNQETNHIVVKSRETLTIPYPSLDLTFKSLEQKNTLVNMIKNYIQKNNLQNITGAYVLDSTQYVITLMDSPNSKDLEVSEKAIFWSIKDYINYSIDDAILDFFTIPGMKDDNNVQLAYAIAMRAKLSEEIGKLLNNSGINLKYMDINELSVRNILSLYPEFKNGCLVLAIIDDLVNILLIKDNTLFISRNTKLDIKSLDSFDPIPTSKEQNIDLEKLHLAEQLSTEVQRSLDYANNMFRNLPFTVLSVLPCKFNLDLVINWLGGQLDLTVNKLDLSEKINFEPAMLKNEQHNYILAIGAALREIVNVTTN